jgi:prolyl 4-hydroxylase
MHINQYGAGVLTIEDFLSIDECAHYIELSEKIGYEASEIDTLTGMRRLEEARNNDRIIYDKPELAALLYERARPHLTEEIQGWKLCGFNDRLRFYRYGQEEYFKWHKDGTFAKSEMEESFLTFMIYLNANFEGGATEFKWESIKPRQGMALVFPHRQLHQGSAVTVGTKYVLRTDVMYRDNNSVSQSS